MGDSEKDTNNIHGNSVNSEDNGNSDKPQENGSSNTENSDNKQI